MRRSNLYAIGAQKNLCSFTNATERNMPAGHDLLRRGQAVRASASSPVARKVDILAEHKKQMFIALHI